MDYRGFKMNIYTDNLVFKEWKERYDLQDEEIKKELDELKEALTSGKTNRFQLIKIKRSYKLPEKGDIFVFQPRENIFFYGLVLNAHINNLQGDDMYVVALFQTKTYSIETYGFQLDYSKLLLSPLMIDRCYWTKGLFYTVNHIDDIGYPPSYGFYKIARSNPFWNEYDDPLDKRPEYLSIGAQTTVGIAYKVNKEFIINKKLLMF